MKNITWLIYPFHGNIRTNIIISMCILFPFIAEAQSIRKNYTEMTELERINVVNAFYQLRFNGDLINDLAVFHGQFFDFTNTSTPNELDIHLNLPNQP